jgi:DNA-binding NtrC family response regulator
MVPAKPLKTVLVIEDDPSERRLLYHALKNHFRILEAADFHSAVECAARERLDLVLLDMHLSPGLQKPPEGLELYRFLRERHPSLPFVVLTGHPDPALEIELLQLGVSAYLTKPADASHLRELLSRAAGE